MYITDLELALEVLTDSRALIADYDHWTTHHNARTPDGKPTVTTDPNACQFCGYGAIIRASNKIQNSRKAHYVKQLASNRLNEKAWQLHQYQSLVLANDDTSTDTPNPEQHTKVLAIFDAAIFELRDEISAQKANA